MFNWSLSILLLLFMPRLAEATEAQWRSILALKQDEATALRMLRERRAQAPNSCWSFADPIMLGDTLYSAAYFPKAYKEFIADFRDHDLGCLREFTSNYAVALGYTAFDREDFKAYCTAQSSSQICEEAKNIEQELRGNLRTLVQMALGDQARLLQAENCTGCQHDRPTPLKSLIDEFKSQNELMACVELKPHETAIIAATATSPTGVPANYALTKLSDNDHRIDLALKLASPQGHGSPTQMMETIQSCAQEFSPYLRGPSGERLELKIYDAHQSIRLPAHKRPPLNHISIAPFGARSTAASYAADIDCPTIAHELLHLLGLCDEYDGSKDGYGCRPRPRVTSIMNDIHRGYDAALPRVLKCDCRAGTLCSQVSALKNAELSTFFISPTVYDLTDYRFRNRACTSRPLPAQNWSQLSEKRFATLPLSSPDHELRIESRSIGQRLQSINRELITCKCPADSPDCIEELARVRQQLAPSAQVSSKNCPASSNVLSQARGTPGDLRPGVQWQGNEIHILVPPTQKSLLLPAHFERITGGACAQAAQKYNSCAQWAYRSPEKTNNCRGKPSFCNDPTEFLGVQK